MSVDALVVTFLERSLPLSAPFSVGKEGEGDGDKRGLDGPSGILLSSLAVVESAVT